MFDTVAGLPVHVLIIHAVVVIAPLTALMAIWYAVRPASRAYLRLPLAAGAVITGVSGLIAGASGEALEHRVRAADSADAAALALVHDHAEAGDLARILCLVLMVVTLAAVFYLLPATGPAPLGAAVAKVTAAAVILASVAAMGSVIITGHTGAKAAWADQVTATNNVAPSGEGDG
jgi:hypothetical protein